MTNYEPSGWLPGEDIPLLLEAVKNTNLIGIEIGVDYGTTSVHLLNSFPNATLYGIDPYMQYKDWHGGEVNNRNEVLEIMTNRLKEFGNRFVHVRKTSDEAVSQFEDESVDFIFIDGLHTYEQVLTDCRNYWPKLKEGGLFCGHDFATIRDVTNAVAFFVSEIQYSKIGHAKQDIWYFYKE